MLINEAIINYCVLFSSGQAGSVPRVLQSARLFHRLLDCFVLHSTERLVSLFQHLACR